VTVFVLTYTLWMTLNGLICAVVPLRNYSLTHSLTWYHFGFVSVYLKHLNVLVDRWMLLEGLGYRYRGRAHAAAAATSS